MHHNNQSVIIMGRKGGALALIGTVAATQLNQAMAWGNKNKQEHGDDQFYSNSVNEWSQASHIAIEVIGCSFADSDFSEDVGCRGDDSGDGTQYWYQMANCKRAQVAYNVYASYSGKTGCGNGDYVGTVSAFVSLFIRIITSAIILYLHV